MAPYYWRRASSWLSRLYIMMIFFNLTMISSSSSSPGIIYGFDRMHKLIQRLDALENAAPDTLMGFLDTESTFSAHPSSSTTTTTTTNKKVCVTSTCYALLTLALCSGPVYEELVSLDGVSSSSSSSEQGSIATTKVNIREAIRAIINSSWREDDLFQVPLLLYTILQVDPSYIHSSECSSIRIKRLIAAVLKARPHRRAGVKQENSDYIIYQVCKVAALLHAATSSERSNNQLPAHVLPEDAESEIFWTLLRCAEVSSNELCRQLAYRVAGDSTSFDVIRLAYSLLTYLRSTSSLSKIAGRELKEGEGLSPEATVAPFNKRSEPLIKAALAAFFQEQTRDGLWDKGQPIYKSFSQGKGRNMGNAFVFPVNTVGSLLCALPAEYFRPHLSALEKTLEWIESHQTMEMIADYCDAKTGQCYGRPLRGWSSPHFDPEAGPQAWSTAQVLKCASWMKTRICQLMHNDVIEEFHGVRFSENGVQDAAWNRLLDSDIGDPSREECRTIKSVLEERVVVPFATSINNPSYGAAYSAILFGPPGTAKTTICESLAQRMGYDFLVIDTAAFLADGLTNVSARIRYVFSRLMALSKCVILFDEIEEFALDRETPGLSMESRMLTTAMLTAINDLRRNRQSIFFIATNRLRAFDSAITRPGRFDLQIFVGTPNLESRVCQFEENLLETGIDEETKSQEVDTFRSFLKSVWTNDIMFMNYLEGLQFASACADIVTSGGKLSNKEMAAILKQQAAVMTVRGSAREEYVASMGLSRL